MNLFYMDFQVAWPSIIATIVLGFDILFSFLGISIIYREFIKK